MAESKPLAFSLKKPSLDKSLRVSPDKLTGGISSAEPFSPDPLKRRFCENLRIRTGMIADSESAFAGYDLYTGCGKWECEICGRQKLAKLRKRISLGKPNKFLTLTTAPKPDETPRKVFERTSSKIKKLFDHFRKIGKTISFVRILESTEAGFPHYHFALRSSFLRQQEISRIWEELTGARIVDIRVIKGQTERYISKYLTKSNHVDYTRQRVSFSRDWPKLEKNPLTPCEDWQGLHTDEIPAYIERSDGMLTDVSPSVCAREFRPVSSGSANLIRLRDQFCSNEESTPFVVGYDQWGQPVF